MSRRSWTQEDWSAVTLAALGGTVSIILMALTITMIYSGRL